MQRRRTALWLITVLALAWMPACANKNGGAVQDNNVNVQQQSPAQLLPPNQAPPNDYRASRPGDEAALPIETINGVKYVSIRQLVDALQYQSEWDPQAQIYRIGDYDAAYEIQMNSNNAIKEDHQVRIPDVPLLRGDNAYLSVASMIDLFKDDMAFDVGDNQVTLRSNGDPSVGEVDSDAPVPAELDFADDPNDPFKGGDDGSAAPVRPTAMSGGSFNADDIGQVVAAASIKNVDVNAMIRKARQYLGVKYKFGTGPYTETGRFDCSTYTKFVFSKFGVDLARTARSQSQEGVQITRKSLRKGDLMFFYVPGRFKSNRVVGHVSIYMGNGQMIHASPSPKNGVQITNVNKAYWKKTFLRAKRLVQ